jgi:hypothetical protein
VDEPETSLVQPFHRALAIVVFGRSRFREGLGLRQACPADQSIEQAEISGRTLPYHRFDQFRAATPAKGIAARKIRSAYPPAGEFCLFCAQQFLTTIMNSPPPRKDGFFLFVPL